MLNLLLAVPAWVSNSFPTIRIVLMCIIAVGALAMIVITLMQSARGETGANVITGATNDSYYMQNKGETKDEVLRRLTIGLAIAIVVCVLIYLTLFAIYPNTSAGA
ncbi:MAG: preprotein translocase subunit SecG [Christensenellaceae bacterium]|jgi:protein translocase SecG subunit|nr:preprotein translocase subunit SecG [Christensenellaceae bacterium]